MKVTPPGKELWPAEVHSETKGNMDWVIKKVIYKHLLWPHDHLQKLRSPAPRQKSMCHLSGLTIGNYKGFLPYRPHGEGVLPTLNLEHSQCTAVPNRSCSRGLRSSWLPLCSYTQSSFGTFILVCLYGTFSQGHLPVPLVRPPYWERKGNLEDNLPTLILYFSTPSFCHFEWLKSQTNSTKMRKMWH